MTADVRVATFYELTGILLVSGALITISGSVRNTATLLEVLVCDENSAPISGLDPANA
jgi:hypothetical protein